MCPRILHSLVLAALVFATSQAVHAQKRYILIDGSSTVYPVLKIAVDEFGKNWDAKVNMEVAFSGTTAGMKKFLSGELDIAGASRPITREELKAAKQYNIPFVEVPIAYDALTIAVHPDCSWVDSIKTTELKTIWERAAEGKITTWKQIRPEWPDTPIKLFGAGKDSGTYDYFKDVIVGRSGALRQDYTASENDDELIAGIEKTPGALGFVPFAYFTKEGDKLKALAVQWDFDAMRNQPVQGAQAVAPSEEAVMRGIYMPFGRPLFVYVNTKSLDAKPHLRDFLNYFLINADDYVERVHYLSLPNISYARSIADLESQKTGTRFFGEPDIGLSVYDMIGRRPR
jgi:phosphate transport system substrate-binding protein